VTLRYWKANTKTSWSVKLVECPACGADLEEKFPATHLSKKHTPDDFGLSPLRQQIAADGGEPR
jgi:hypothetical protein